MHYLFLRKKSGLEEYRREFDRVSAEIKAGKTPVFSEMRCARTNLIESIPYNCLNGAFLVAGTLLLQSFHMNEIVSLAVVLVINSVCGALANYIFSLVKHRLRLKLCRRLGVEESEHSIAVMESLEYQSV